MVVPPGALARRRICDHFLSADAVRPDSAVPFKPSTSVERRVLGRLQDHGVIHAVSVERFYLDVPAYHDQDSRGRRQVLLIVAAVLAIGLAMRLMG